MKANDDTFLDVTLIFNGGPPGAVKHRFVLKYYVN